MSTKWFDDELCGEIHNRDTYVDDEEYDDQHNENIYKESHGIFDDRGQDIEEYEVYEHEYVNGVNDEYNEIETETEKNESFENFKNYKKLEDLFIGIKNDNDLNKLRLIVDNLTLENKLKKASELNSAISHFLTTM